MVVGGGPIGVELAGALAELARTGLEKEDRAIDPATARVILVQSASRGLPAFSPVLSAHAERSPAHCGPDGIPGRRRGRVTGREVARTGRRHPAASSSTAILWFNGRAGIFATGDRAASDGWAGAGVPGWPWQQSSRGAIPPT